MFASFARQLAPLVALTSLGALAGCYSTGGGAGCPEIWAPVCGADGNTYDNSCEAERAGTTVAHSGGCGIGGECLTDSDCGAGARCALPRCAEPPPDPCTPGGDCDEPTPRCGDEPGVCIGCACTEEYAPVCGADGRTYSNACEASCAAVDVAHAGECGVECPAIGCPPIWCEYGMLVDESGCPTCECAPPPECRDEDPCDLPCPYGYATGSDGCAICECLPPPPECEPVTCDLWCPNGYETDERGCQICECVEGPVCLPVACDLFCEYGYALDENGCETCSCNPAPECPELDCTNDCEHGYVIGPDGCQTCECNSGPQRLCQTDADCGSTGSCNHDDCYSPPCPPGMACPPVCYGICR